ncbi:DedA family protein [Enterobacteriaceae endosymbiont of Plateumaris consimilis]|uniref:DedA family protein n=1 Tax=Enterobacteriaceae endosymbiont of Plateumaris consimilis TaxID=2675794 RepID=UPI0014499192|nr:VTT domain-containing protein [Enterobacteriaceae endosymbiont of Plateumaris consimilis]QJC28763.1 DedA family protein [Enterobacteriaceae endosymbiont of Plateumaris consimilis]
MFDIDITKIINQYGYLIILIGSLIEGETFIIIGGIAIHKGLLIYHWVIIISTLGAIIGDQFLFYIGKKYSNKLLFFLKKNDLKVHKYQNLITNYPYIFIIMVRFMYGFRLIGPIIIGITNITTFKFLIFNIIGSIIWSLIFVSLGFVFGDIITSWIGDINKITIYVLYILVFIFILKIIYKIIKK